MWFLLPFEAQQKTMKMWCNLPQLMKLEAGREELHTPICNKQQQLMNLHSTNMELAPPEDCLWSLKVQL